ncbi:MAG: spermidine/putrescine ABC transporter substrate-binding protein [Clostridia bacterium]|nr:spermidine/putrescine ABC transporter substrate-binding protein [Clostridia bacterium]
MKKIFAVFSLFTLLAISSSALKVEDESYYEAFRGKGIKLNVFNWGEYISDGSEGTMDVLEEFEKISGIEVVYNNYETNEDLYAKLSAGKGNTQYDIIIPSDYMISRMIRENMLEKINFDNIPNVSMLDDKYRYPDFDKTGEYSVPYTWGTVGIVYNTKYVDKEDTGSWDLLWNKKYAGNILMFSNSRDAYGIALKKLGYSLNSTNRDEIEDATELLKEQRSVNQAYVMDQTFDKMENESAYIAPYYAGDCLSMMENNENLAFYYPEEGFNIFIDSICIPKGAKHKEAAEAFINFLCETEVAVANCEYICYFTPHTEAAKVLEFDERIYPTEEQLLKAESYVALPDSINSIYDSSWIEVRSSLDISELVIVGIILGLALTVLIVLTIHRRMKKGKINY